MAFKHIAVYDGATFTRTSQKRIYTHCIVCIYNIKDVRQKREANAREYWQKNLHYFQECAEGKHPQQVLLKSHFHPSRGMDDPQKYAAYVSQCAADSADIIARAKEWLAKGEQGLVAEYLAQFDENMKATPIASNGVDFYSAGDQWCGRQDLADKALGSWFKQGVRAVAVAATYAVVGR